MEDPHGVRAAGVAHDNAVPEDLRRNAGRLNAVRAGRIPGPRDPGARRNRIDGRVLAAVLRAAVEDVAHGDVDVGAERAWLAVQEVVHHPEVLRSTRAAAGA